MSTKAQLEISIVDLKAEIDKRIVGWMSQKYKGHPSLVPFHIQSISLQTYDWDITYPVMEYGTVERRVAPPFMLDTITEKNEGTTADTFVYAKKRISNISITTKVTRAVKTGITAGLKIPLGGGNGKSPGFTDAAGGELNLGISQEVNFSDETTVQSSASQEWDWSVTISQAPKSATKVSVLLSRQEATIPVSATMKIAGTHHVAGTMKIPLGFDNAGFDEKMPIGEIFSITPLENVVTVLDAHTIQCPVAAVFEVVYGTDIVIDKEVTPL